MAEGQESLVASEDDNRHALASGQGCEGDGMAEGQEILLSPEDDSFHPIESDRWFEHETSWFAFYVPEERNLGAWVFNYIRPNAGVSGGGVVLWDDTGWFHMETPY